MQLKLPTKIAESVLKGVSGVFSALGFIYMYGQDLIQAWSGWIFGICTLALLVSLYLKNKVWARSLQIIVVVFLVLFVGNLVREKIRARRYDAEEELANVTLGFADGYGSCLQKISIGDRKLLEEAVRDEKMDYLLVPTSVSDSTLLRGIERKQKDIITVQDSYEIDKKLLKSDYYIIAVYNRNNRLKYRQSIIVLPESVSIAMKGVTYLSSDNDWDEGFRCLRKSDSLGNAGATLLLAKWLSIGLGKEPASKETVDSLTAAAAAKGAREACYKIGSSILESEKTSREERAKAEETLLRACTLKRVASHYDIAIAFKAIQLLNEFYLSTGRVRDAYKLTKKNYKKLPNPNVGYKLHLDNCLLRGKYSEAVAIVKEAEPKGFPYAFLVHARMAQMGLGMEKDLGEAERLYRYCADTLGIPMAYRELAQLYREQEGDSPRAEFLEGLADVDFKGRVE